MCATGAHSADAAGEPARGYQGVSALPGNGGHVAGGSPAGGNRAAFLAVDEVVDVVRYLLLQDANVQMGPEILIRTMRNPFEHP